MVTATPGHIEAPVVSDEVTTRADLSPAKGLGHYQPLVSLSISGETVRVALISSHEFIPANPETANEYRAALKVVSEAARLTQSLADRLMDPLDGKTVEIARALVEHKDVLSAHLGVAIDGYLYGIAAAGGNLDCAAGAVMIPPVSKEKLTAAVAHVPALQNPNLDTSAVIAHLFEPRPNIGQGFYIFKSSADWNRFNELVTERHPEISTVTTELRDIFNQATGVPDLPHKIRAKYEELSRKILAAQESTLEDLLDRTPGAFDPCTRVYLELRAGLAPNITVVPYSSEFRPELTRLSGHLLTAENLLPAEAVQLRALIKSQVAWCLTASGDERWGMPSEQWIETSHSEGAIDIQFNCAETVALLGEKRNFQLVAAQSLSPNEVAALQLESPTVSFPAGFGAPESRVPFMRLMESAGAARYPIASREESISAIPPTSSDIVPTEQSIEVIKRPVFVNVAPLGVLHDLSSLREVAPTALDALARASILVDALKAANRTDSDTQYILGSAGEVTSHGYAFAGAFASVSRCRPENVQPVLNVLAGYDTLVALRSGTSSGLDRATLGIVQELERRGAITLDVSSGGLKVTAVDPLKLREVAQVLQHQLQLWQLGIPLIAHRKLLEESGIDRSLAPPGVAFARSLDQITRRRMRDEARDEVESRFNGESLAPIREKLSPLLDTIPRDRLVAELPSDPIIRALLLPHSRNL
ncbi:MAG: hypothetical protein RL417_382 [Pseudomonadota bacterium]